MTPRIGLYHYTVSGRYFRIYRYISVSPDGRNSSSEPVVGEPLFDNRESARRRVYQLNGWPLHN